MTANVAVSKPKSDAVFGGVATSRAASSKPTDFRSAEDLAKRDRIRKVLSISLKESDAAQLAGAATRGGQMTADISF